ncbi:MAG: hypothetical protein Roseis2KO_23000 [Roseivirga sp.]
MEIHLQIINRYIMKKNKIKHIITWAFRVIAAFIMLQTLFFKFSGAEESVFIFTQIGMEPFGRYLSGSVELIAGVLLLTRFYAIGAALGLGTISGAIFFHLTTLGIEVQGDGGTLFIMAIVVFVSSALTILLNLEEVKTKYLPVRFKTSVTA